MIVTNLLTLHNQLKINHWQTKKYSEHQALGAAYDEFSDLVDQFIEVLMGKYGRIRGKNGFTIELKDYQDLPTETFVNKYIDYLVNELPKGLEESDTDLLNIRDEMLAELNKLKYLLTLE